MKPIFIRGIDPELYKRARVESVRESLTIGKWLNLAIICKLNQDAATKPRKKEGGKS